MAMGESHVTSVRMCLRSRSPRQGAIRVARLWLLATAFAVFLTTVLLAPGTASAITRDQVIANAKSWTDIAVPYSETARYEGYRTDCVSVPGCGVREGW